MSVLLAGLVGPFLLAGPALGLSAAGDPGASSSIDRPPPDLLAPDLDVRSLPSLVVRWTCHCNPAGATVGPAPGGGAVYVQGYRRFFALDAETHDVLWDRRIEGAGRALAPPLLLGDRLAVVYAERLFVVEPVSGVIVAEVEPAGRIDRAVGPPLTVMLVRRSGESGSFERELVRIDEASGQVVARRRLEILDLAARDGRLLAVRMAGSGPASAGDSHPEPDRLLELSPDDLATLRSWPGADAHFLEDSRGSGDLLVPFRQTDAGPRFVRLEALGESGTDGGATGALVPYDGSYALDAELRVEPPPGGVVGGATTLRRVDPGTGETLWATRLPHRPGASLWDDDRLLVHTRPRSGGRGLLVGLDAATGEVLTAAYGFAGVRSLDRWGDLLIAVSAEEVVAFEAGELGPPEAQVRPVAEEVDRLLDRLEGRRFPHADRDVFQELEALGPEAHPLLLARLPALAPQAALTVAGVLGQAGYEPAAPRIAELLQDFPDPPEDAPEEWLHTYPKADLLRYLAPVAGEAQLPAIGAVLLDDEEAPQVHEQALATLAEIGTPAVVPWVDRFYGLRAGDAAPAWIPPDLHLWRTLHLADPRPGQGGEDRGGAVPGGEDGAVEGRREGGAREPDGAAEAPREEAVAEALSDEEQKRLRFLRRTAGWTAVAEDGDRELLVVYESGRLSTRPDLWAAPLRPPTPAPGEPEPPLFLGFSLDDLAPGRDVRLEDTLRAELSGSRLTLWLEGERSAARAVDLDAAARDRDGDGLTDLAEGRLTTDPERPDTDGDGRPDPTDPAPRGGAEPRSEEERIRRTVIRHLAVFRGRHETGPFCVVSERPLEWSRRGFGKILLPVRPGADSDVHRRCQTLAARPATEEEVGQSRRQIPELAPGDRLWVVTKSSEHFGEAHWVVLRPVAGRWLVRRMTLWWIT